MKIVIDARILSLTTGRYVDRLLHHLQDMDSKNEYVVLLLAKDMKKWQPRADNFTKLEADFPIYSPGEQTGLYKLLMGLEADLVHFTMPQHPLLYRRPHIVTVHDLTLVDWVNKRRGNPLRQVFSNYVKPAAFKAVMRSAAKSRAVITPTKFVRAQILARYGTPGARVHVTYEAADPLAGKAREADFGQGKDFLIYVGNAYPYKNLKLLIEAYRQLHRPELKLVLVGKKDYFYQELERATKAQGIEGVIFPGFVPDDQLRWLFEHAKLYVFPSLSEGFGLPPLEAMQYGLPVLSSNATCLPEVYGDGAQYFDPHSTENLTKNIESLLDDDKRREALGQAGRERVKKYSWERMAEQTLEIYKRVG